MAPNRLALLPLGVDIEAFRPSADAEDCRRRRIRSGEPLCSVRWLALIQEGPVDRARRRAPSGQIPCHARGPADARNRRPRGVARLAGRDSRQAPAGALPSAYATADVFLFPRSRTDSPWRWRRRRRRACPSSLRQWGGHAFLVQPNRDGWDRPDRDVRPSSSGCSGGDANRDALVGIIDGRGRFPFTVWADVASDFERICIGADINSLSWVIAWACLAAFVLLRHARRGPNVGRCSRISSSSARCTGSRRSCICCHVVHRVPGRPHG